MNSQWKLDPGRLAFLMRNDIVSQAKSITFTAGAAFAFMLVSWVFNVITGMTGNFYPFFFGVTMVVGGPILTSLAFSELHHPLRGISYLTLPGSQLEKYLSKLLLTSVGFAAAAVLFFYVFSLAAALGARLAFGLHMPLFAVTGSGTYEPLIVFLSLHPFIFFGGIYFRRLALVKTMFSIFSFMIALGILAMLVGWSLFASMEGDVALHNLVSNLSDYFKTHASTLKLTATLVFRVFMPIFFIGLGYLRLTEYEVNNGV